MDMMNGLMVRAVFAAAVLAVFAMNGQSVDTGGNPNPRFVAARQFGPQGDAPERSLPQMSGGAFKPARADATDATDTAQAKRFRPPVQPFGRPNAAKTGWSSNDDRVREAVAKMSAAMEKMDTNGF